MFSRTPKIRIGHRAPAWLGVMLMASASTLAMGSAYAEDSGAELADTQVVTLDEIVVTSTGFGQSRAKHPGNISKISGTEIQFEKPQQPSEILNQVAGVGIQQGSGVEHLTAIRSPVLTGGAGAGSFLYLEDGVPLRAAGFGNVNALMESITEGAGGIEVVRGPGSALYGSNAEHGLVNVLSMAPSEEPEARLTGWLGPHGNQNLNGSASSTITEAGGTVHGFRGTFALNEDGGFRDDSSYGQQKLQLRYDITKPETRIRTTLSAINLNQETAGFITGFDAYKDPAVYKTNPNPDAYRDAWAMRGAMRVEHDLSRNESIAITPYFRTNGMEFLMHFLPGTPVEESGHWSLGLLTSYEKRLSGGHKIILGLDSEYTDGYLSEIQSGPAVAGYVTGTHYDYDIKSTVIAPYLHTVWSLTPATELTAGLRYEFTRYEYDNKGGATSALLYAADRSARPDDRTDTYAIPTPKLGLVHVFSDTLTGFANIARAARAPQTTDIYRLQKVPGTAFAIDPGSVDPEILDSIELGARGRIGQARYEVSTYYMKKRNYTFRDSAGNTIFDGRTRHVGIEAEIATPLIWNFDIAASATYARHTYEFDNPADGIVAGNDVDSAPRTLSNVRLGYSFHETRGRLELEWVHMGSYETDAANLHSYSGHDLLNLRADYSLSDNLSVFGRVSNLLDTRYADRADYTGFGGDRYFPGEDRALYAGATIRF